MSILIKGMKMPKTCYDCPFFKSIYHLHGCHAVPKSFDDMDMWDFVGDRPSWCPLVELPPHGDLIDRDALTHKIYSEIPFKVFKNVGRVSDMVLLVWDAPIILTDKDINVPIKEGE